MVETLEAASRAEGHDRYARQQQAQEAAQRIVDRSLPPLPYHPTILGFGVYAVAEVALELAGVDGQLQAISFIMGVAVWVAGARWERLRDRRLEREMGRLRHAA